MNKQSNNHTHMRKKHITGARRVLMVILFAFTLLFSTSITDKKAEARCCVCCPQVTLYMYHVQTILSVTSAHTAAFTMLRDQLLSVSWWQAGVQPLAKMMAMELSTIGWAQIAQIGAFIDGKVLGETITDMQVMSAKTAKRQMPAVSMCKFASLNKSLAASDSRAKMVHAVLNEYSLRRILGQAETAGATQSRDTKTRFRQMATLHCDPYTQGSEMQNVCSGAVVNNGYTNKDINFTDAIDTPDTINLGLDGDIAALLNNTDNNPLNDNEIPNIVAMKQFLYKHELAPRASKESLASDVDGHRSRYLRWRGSVAKRSVAENSFDALVGMKASSALAGSNAYQLQLATLGVPNAEIQQITKVAPSYWAQMEQLSKTIYQNPDFFVNLYDNPHNVMRQSAAMEAISLMQMRDYYDSLIRSEMALSVLLDTEVSKEIDALNNVITQWGY